MKQFLTNSTKFFAKHTLATGELIARNIVENIVDAVESFESVDTRIYKSSFGDADDIISSEYSGFCIDGIRCLPRHMSYESCYLQGPTGSGKTSVHLINSILRMTESTQIIHDPAGELRTKTSGYLKSKGYNIYVLNFGNPAYSHFFNPLDHVQTESEISKLSNILVRTVLGTHGTDPFWNLQSISMLNTIVGIVLSHETQKRNFANVRYILKAFAGSRKKVDGLFVKKANERLFADYKSILAMESRVLSSVIATSMAATTLWSDDDICRVTASSSFDFASLRKTKCAVYIQNNTADARYYSPLVSIFFELLFKEIMSKIPDEKDLDVFMLIDEAATLYLPNLATAVCNVRKHRAGILTAWQSFESVVNAYGAENAEVIRTNSLTKIYFTGQNLKTAEELERILGRVEVTDGKGNSKIKPLMLAEEIRTMKHNEAIIISGARNPFKVSLTPYYLQPYINMRTKLKSHCVNNDVEFQIPYIPLP